MFWCVCVCVYFPLRKACLVRVCISPPKLHIVPLKPETLNDILHFRQYIVAHNNYVQHSVYYLWSCRCTYIIVVTTALSAEGRLVVELVLEIVLTQVAQGCAHLRMLQLFLWRRNFIDTYFARRNTWPELYAVVLIFVLTVEPKTTHTFCGHINDIWKCLPHKRKCLGCKAYNTGQHRRTHSAARGAWQR